MLNAPAVAVVAESGIARLVLEASLTIERLPLADPPDCGVKVTLKVLLWPAARIAGTFKPLTVKPTPVTLA